MLNFCLFRWTFNDGPLPLNALLMDSLTVSILSIRETNNLNGGAYTCTVNDTDRGVINRDTSYVDIVGTCYIVNTMYVLTSMFLLLQL